MELTYAEIEELTGFVYRTIRKRLGDLAPVGVRGKSNLYDSAEALKRCYGPLTAQDGLDPAQEKAKLDEARRIAQEMKNAELEGKLLPLEDITDLWSRVILAAKTKILGIKSKCAPAIHDFIDDQENREALLTVIDSFAREALAELAEVDY